jgi:nucleotide-binding universal stress UspA family protein
MSEVRTVGPIVVPLDGSSLADVAIPMARTLAERTGAELHLVHVMAPAVTDPFHPDEQPAMEAHVRRRSEGYLQRVAAEGLGDMPVRTELLAAEGGIAAAIAAHARRERASWILLATHGAGGLSRWVLGSVADALVRTAGTPLFLVRPWDATGDLAEDETAIARILVPLDGSTEAETALGPAAGLARSFGAALDVIRVVAPRPHSAELHAITLKSGSEALDREADDYLEARVAALRKEGVTAEGWRVAHEDPAEGIRTAAVERGADVVVMSTHGRGGLARAVIGSVADRLLRRGVTILALVRPEESGRGGAQPAVGPR